MIFRAKKREKTDSNEERWLIAGLGNPGPQYSRTWHNAGYMTVEMFAQRHEIKTDRIKFKGLYGQGIAGGQRLILLKPATYMNSSGESVKEAMSFYKIPPERVIIVYDDIDIALGRIRVRKSGGPGTHNGMRSVIEHLGTQGFPRVRIGIGPAPEIQELASFVLSEVTEDKKEILFTSLSLACEAVEDLLKNA